MFHQLLTYDECAKRSVNGVVNFRVEDIASFWKPKIDEYNQGLVHMSLKGGWHPYQKNSCFRVEYKDLMAVILKSQSK